MIELINISKQYETLDAIKDVSLSVRKGSIYGLVGSNGAGKTTLLKILAGIYKQDSGELLIDSQAVFENNRIKERLVFIPDFLYFFPNYTIQDMAVFYARVNPKFWNQTRFEKLSMLFNLQLKRRIKTLSKGMQRQLAFCLAFSLMPDVMILDEPIDGLDAVMRQKVKNLIIKDVAERDMTVIISSHNLRDLEDICDYIGILHEGKMIIQKDLDELKADIHKIQIAFNGETPPELLQNSKAIYQDKRGSVLILILRGKQENIIKEMQSLKPAILDVLPLTLEEIFIYEMGGYGYEINNIIS